MNKKFDENKAMPKMITITFKKCRITRPQGTTNTVC